MDCPTIAFHSALVPSLSLLPVFSSLSVSLLSVLLLPVCSFIFYSCGSFSSHVRCFTFCLFIVLIKFCFLFPISPVCTSLCHSLPVPAFCQVFYILGLISSVFAFILDCFTSLEIKLTFFVLACSWVHL